MIGDKSGKSGAFLSGPVKVGFYFSDSFQIFAVGCDHSQQIKSQICIVGGRGGGGEGGKKIQNRVILKTVGENGKKQQQQM